MADEQKPAYPDLPVDQWFKLRNFFRRNLPGSVNIDYLMSALSISESTARNTLRNLVMLGIASKDGRLTDMANDWRDDDHYSQVCAAIRDEVYPRELLDVAAASEERSSIEGWFIRKAKIGEKAAKKNAAIFEVINEGDLSKIKDNKGGKGAGQVKSPPRQRKSTTLKTAPESTPERGDEPQGAAVVGPTPPKLLKSPFSPSIHIDVQIHISPDAKAEQIDHIFASIAKHLYEPRQIGDGRNN